MKTLIKIIVIVLSSGILKAQDTIRTLIISEARFDESYEAYCELTNVGATTLSLKNFEFGHVNPWDSRIDVNDVNKWFNISTGDWFMLPDWQLAPGKSIVIANVFDWELKMWRKDPDKYIYPNITKPEMWKLADIQLNQPEAPVQPTAGDSVSPNYSYNIGQVWFGRDCWYVRHHVAPGDSVVVDQVGGVFTDPNGQQSWNGKDVAGVTAATQFDILIRKFTVKKGNINFFTGRGTTATESEWIVIPTFDPGGWEPNRAVLWTVGNHVDAHLDVATLVSSTLSVNFADSTITVPWGIRNDDSIMYQFTRKPGLGWHYDYVKSHEDSAYVSIRTGDILTLYACGNVVQLIPFKLKVSAPKADANIVLPKKVANTHFTYIGAAPFCQVTDKVPVMDTIRGNILYGIAYATRVDSLFKYLEKAPKAKWEIVWVDGNTRTDLKNGDILKVTAEDGTTKKYFIKIDKYRPAHNAFLASITWPDIPDAYRGFYGWTGDTIPTFSSSKYTYIVQMPATVNSIPALVAKNQDINARIQIERAKNLIGTVADKTITITSIAEDDTSKLVYSIQVEKLKYAANIQPWLGEPFISQYCFRQDYNNDFLEIVNPGTGPLDLTHYMIVDTWGQTPADAITGDAAPTAAGWYGRYHKYIPGMRWQDSTAWKVTPAIAVQDLSGIQPIVLPGDVFVMADKRSVGGTAADYLIPQIDIDFAHNPWGETLNQGDAMDNFWAIGTKYFFFKILNDSVYNGKKSATDPNDFKVIDAFGYHSATTDNWVIGGINGDQVTNWIRKPYIYKGNPLISTGVYPGGSFGTNETNSEWIMVNESRLSLPPYSYSWPNTRILVADGIGSHFMNEVTFYKSTINSLVYKYSEGYSLHENLWGVKTGTTVKDFEANILKVDTGQTLTLLSHVDGAVLNPTDNLLSNDTLLVVSADKNNKTKYILTVTTQGLSNDAHLTSTKYTINVTDTVGNISGFPYCTTLKMIVDSIAIPAGASLTIIDASGSYVPLKCLNTDTVYVYTKVNNKIYFEVIAENGVNRIVYQLLPNSNSSDAFVTSDFYIIDQVNSVIDAVIEGATVYGLSRYLTPAPGASFVLVDKFGFQRSSGYVAKDDRLVVTAADGITKRVYLFTKDLFDVELGPDKLINCGDTVQFSPALTYQGKGTLTYFWSPANGLSSTNIPNPIALITTITKYVLTLTSPEYGTIKDSINVSVSPLINAGPLIGNSSICEGTSGLLYSVAAITNARRYKWTLPAGFSGNSSTNIISVNVSSGASSGEIRVAGVNGGCTGKDTALSISVNALPVISRNPYAVSVCAGTNTGFRTIATGTGLTYQWQLSTNSGASWNNIDSAGSNPVYANWTLDSLQVGSAQTANNGYEYRCIIKNAGNCTDTSNITSLNVSVTPFAAGPVSGLTSVCEGTGNLSYSLSTITNATTYKWTLPPGFSGNSSTNTISVNVTSGASSGEIRVAGVNGGCTGKDTALSISVNALPVILRNLYSVSVCAGTNTGFRTIATGTGLTYQWQLSSNSGASWNNIDSAGSNPVYANWTLDSLQVGSAQAANNGYEYRCIINNAANCQDTSNIGFLSIETAPSAAGPITGLASVCQGAGSLSYSISSIANATSYKWTLPTGFSGNSTGLSISINVSSSANTGKIRVNGVNGGCSGKDTMLNVNVLASPVITRNPYQVSACAGTNSGFRVLAIGTGLTYQWQLSINAGVSWNNIVSAGSNPVYLNWTADSLEIGNMHSTNNGYHYRCVVSNSSTCSSVSSSTNLAVLSLPVAAGTITGSSNVCVGSNDNTYSVSAIIGATTYSWALPMGFTGSSATNSISVSVASSTSAGVIHVKGMNGVCAGTESTLSIATLPLPGTPGLITGSQSLCQSSTNNNYSISTVNGATSYQWSLPSGCSGNSTGNSIGLDVCATAASGNILVKAINVCGPGPQSQLSVTIHKPVTPQIKVKWHDVLICMNLGDSIASYQWYKDGTAIANAIKQYYVTHKQAGNYMVMVTDKNSCTASSKTVNSANLKSMVLSPNPAKISAELALDCEETGKLIIKIFNSAGELLKTFQEDKQEETHKTILDLTSLLAGIYFVQVQLNDEVSEYTKLVIGN